MLRQADMILAAAPDLVVTTEEVLAAELEKLDRYRELGPDAARERARVDAAAIVRGTRRSAS